ncbi:hypothetical protein OIO90_005411 [Microbotryomycetes sp. JL221]|nr:hypothetical protein OIO90_005411 [Microbotryomycetes sp. JL221]
MPRQGRQPRQTAPSHSNARSGQRSKKSLNPNSRSTTTTSSRNTSSRNSVNKAIDDDLDVYTYQPGKRKARGDVDPLARAKPSQHLHQRQSQQRNNNDDNNNDDDDDDEMMGFYGDDIVEFTGVKPKNLKMGIDSDQEAHENDDDNDDDDDEDIDSDEAAGQDSDDEPLSRNATNGRSDTKTPVKKQVRLDVDLDEDAASDQDDEDEDGEGFIDASEMLDMGAYSSEEDEEDNNHDDDEANSQIDSDEQDDSDGDFDKLTSFVDNLDGKKRKLDGQGQQLGNKRKRIVLKERTEALPEGEFVAIGARDSNDGKVNLDDLLGSFADSKDPKLASLRKSLKPLASSSTSTLNAAPSSSKAHLKSAGPLAAPLPARLQDKIDREAAYEQTKQQVDGWNETVRKMKGQAGLSTNDARHEKLSLPLLGGAGDVHRDANANDWTAKFQPTNDLEMSIQQLLEQSQMSQSALRKQENKALASLDPQELIQRQAELRKQRDLMYQAERKAKRVAKIKSKTYRRIHRKQKDKDAIEGGLSLEDLAELDKIDGGDRVGQEQARLEILRAKERATLKHSSKGGRWSRTDIGGLDGLDAERNAAVRDMVAKGEQLRRRIAGIDSGDEQDEFDDDDSEEDDDEADLDQIKQTAFDELKSLEEKEAALKASAPKAKGVMGMKFMQDALRRNEAKANAQAQELRRTLEGMDDSADIADVGDDDEAPVAMHEQVGGNLGRMVFGPSAGSTKSTDGASHDKPTSDDDESATPTVPKSGAHTTKLSSSLAVPSVSRSTKRSPLSAHAADAAEEEANPWLAASGGDAVSKVSRKSNKAAVTKDARDADKIANKASKQKSKQIDARIAEQQDAQVDIDLSNVMSSSSNAVNKPQIDASSVQKSTNGKNKASAQVADGDDSDDDVEGVDDVEQDDDEIDAQRGKGKAAIRQRELVAKAFAGDNVLEDFEEEKRRITERDAPQEEDMTLPGWGSWAGKGVKKSKKPSKKFIKTTAGIDPQTRKDASLNHVIISERKDKKAQKYMLKDLPFPYTSVAQHEHKLRTPMGPEWSTSTVLRDQTMPSVLIKPGVTIRPVDRKV